jgi:hypothetical protein
MFDPVAVIAALKQEVAAESAVIKNAIVLIGQFDAKVKALETDNAALQAQIAAVPDVTTGVQTDTKSLSDTIAQFSASGQLSA